MNGALRMFIHWMTNIHMSYWTSLRLRLRIDLISEKREQASSSAAYFGTFNSKCLSVKENLWFKKRISTASYQLSWVLWEHSVHIFWIHFIESLHNRSPDTIQNQKRNFLISKVQIVINSNTNHSPWKLTECQIQLQWQIRKNVKVSKMVKSAWNRRHNNLNIEESDSLLFFFCSHESSIDDNCHHIKWFMINGDARNTLDCCYDTHSQQKKGRDACRLR